MVPTAPKPCTVAEVEADPIGANSRLGTYTNFVNLLDLAGIAVPIALTADNTPYGITLLGPAGRDARLARPGAALHAPAAVPPGGLALSPPPPGPPTSAPPRGTIAHAAL